jgi:hypothetical protein
MEVEMEGYDVVTNDDKKFGRVVRVEGSTIVVEHGTLLKHKIALPRDLTEVDEASRTVRTTVSKQLLADAPKVEGDSVEKGAVAAYFGLAGDADVPNTEGYGETLPEDPARTADEEGHGLGVPTGEEERLRVRKSVGETESAVHRPAPSPGITGGDRFRDAPGADSTTE